LGNLRFTEAKGEGCISHTSI